MRTLLAAVCGFSLVFASGAAFPGAVAHAAQPTEGLAPYFGFDEMRIIKVDPRPGPMTVADFNGNGRPDLAIANNGKSRIEIHYLRSSPRPPEEMQRVQRANELPLNPWYDREFISVAHNITSLIAHDVDGDGQLDLIYAGSQPSELVVMRQASPTRFELLSRQRVPNLAARKYGLAVANVMGDDAAELLAIVDGRVNAYPMDRRGRLGEPVVLGSGSGSSGAIRAFHVADFSGNGRLDILGVVPEDSAPLRLWLQSGDPRSAEGESQPGVLGSEVRFEMPPLRDAKPLIFPERDAASIAVIERASGRLVCYDMQAQAVAREIENGTVISEREVQAEVSAFMDSSRNRSVAVADITGNGLDDLLTPDQRGNAVVLHRQEERLGLSRGVPFSAFKAPKQIDVGHWSGSSTPEVFVLSEEERTVGISRVVGERGDRRLMFPEPIPFEMSGGTPIVMTYLEMDGDPVLAVVLKDRRDFVLELHRQNGQSEGEAKWSADVTSIPLRDVRRDPAALVPFDFDGDGISDLLIMTPGEPMMMVRCIRDEEGQIKADRILTRENMPQFGLVQAAGPENTALLDVNGDGREELLIADSNFVRAAAYDMDAGWRVVEQINAPESSTQLVGISLLEDFESNGEVRIVAADRGNGRLLIMGRNEDGLWGLQERVRLLGFQVGPIRAGAFAGDGKPGVLCIGDDSFALVRLGGERHTLEEFAAFRSESESRLDHEMAAGDVNGDGFVDLVVLDAREQMCQILTFSASRRLHPAMEFKVFETMQFTRGDPREMQPSMAIVQDLTGNGKDDLLLVVHDRVIVYPQATEPN